MKALGEALDVVNVKREVEEKFLQDRAVGGGQGGGEGLEVVPQVQPLQPQHLQLGARVLLESLFPTEGSRDSI